MRDDGLAESGLTVEPLGKGRYRVTGLPRTIPGWFDWVAQPTYVIEGDDVRLVRLDIFAKRRDNATATMQRRMLRDLTLPRVQENVRQAQRIAELMERHGELGIDRRTLKAVGKALRARGSGRPREWTDSELARLAQRYVELVTDGPRKSPYPTLEAEWGLPSSTIRGMLATARREDRGPLLTSLGQGRAGGTLTPKAKRLVRKGTPNE